MKLDTLIQKRFKDLIDQIPSLTVEKSSGAYVKIREFSSWGMSAQNLIKRVFGTNSLQFSRFDDEYENAIGGEYNSAEICIGILQSAYDDYVNGYLFNVRTLLKAELGDEILEQANMLLVSGYKDIACVLIGIALELAIKDLCSRKGIPYDDKTKADQLNIELRKSEVYNESMRKQVTAWLALRNHAAHGEWDQYKSADVKDLLRGVQRFVGEHLN